LIFSIQFDLPLVTTHKSCTAGYFEFARFQAPRNVVDASLFSYFVRRRLVVGYRRFEKTYRSHFQKQSSPSGIHW